MRKHTAQYFKLAILTVLITCALSVSGCGKTENADNPYANLDTSGFHVGYDIHMGSNLLFIPNYFGEVYGVDSKYEDAIDAWGDFDYATAETNLLEVEEAIEKSENHYYPDDIAFVKEALGLLYYDMAAYDKAYDNLLDAYVTMDDLYGNKKNLASGEQFYPQAIGIALCHYYYTIGDYDRCLKEIQSIRDDYEAVSEDSGEFSDYQLFINTMLNDIEAGIYKDRGEYEKAHDLYDENIEACRENSKSGEDSSLGSILGIDACTHMADCFSSFTTDSELAEKVDSYYDLALSILDGFGDGDLRDKKKSEVLLKKGWYLTHFSDMHEEGRNLLEEAVSMQEKLYESGKKTPDIVDAYVKSAELYGFVDNDLEKALEYYDKALDLAETVYGENHPKTAMVYESLGRFYGNRMNDVDQSIDYFNKGVDIYNNLLIENNVLMAGMYLQLAGCHKIKGENEASDEYLNKAYDMWGKLGIHVLQTDGTWK